MEQERIEAYSFYLGKKVAFDRDKNVVTSDQGPPFYGVVADWHAKLKLKIFNLMLAVASQRGPIDVGELSELPTKLITAHPSVAFLLNELFRYDGGVSVIYDQTALIDEILIAMSDEQVGRIRIVDLDKLTN